MLPYLHLENIAVGPLTFHPWGFVVGIAFVVAILVAARHARCVSLNSDHLWNMSVWIVLAAIVGARLFHIFAYEWIYYSQHISEIPKLWNGGLASFGGYIGGTIAAFAYLRYHRLLFLPWADLAAFVLPLGIGIGRIACYLVNMHPGIPTTFFLGVHYPDIVRHDLGVYLSINGFLLFVIFLFLFYKTKPKPPGFYLTFFLLWYGTTRFFLDFLRSYDLPMSDTRYFYLTPAQYGAIGFFLIGCILVFYLCRPHPSPRPRQLGQPSAPLPKGEGT